MDEYSWIPKHSFEETNWWRLNQIAQGGASAETERNELCKAYWYPLYAYLRRKSYSPEDAQELTQEFLTRFIEGADFGELSPAKGRFRSYLLAALNNFLANEWRREQTQKRGGGTVAFSINAVEGETQFFRAPSKEKPASRFYDLQWARTVMDRALLFLREDFEKDGKLALYEELKAIVEDEQSDEDLATIAARVQMRPETFRKNLQRFRTHYRERLQTEVGLTVNHANQVDQETQFIRKVLRG